jgi:hypothetical protein
MEIGQHIYLSSQKDGVISSVVNTYKIVVVLMDCIVLKYEKLLK